VYVESRPSLSVVLAQSLFLILFFRAQVIGALAGLTDALEDDVKAGLRTDSRRCAPFSTLLRSPSLTRPPAAGLFSTQLNRTANPENIDAIIARGTALWNSIYEPHAVKLHDKLASYHPDLICTFPSSLPFPPFPLPPFPWPDGSWMWKVDGISLSPCLASRMTFYFPLSLRS
jgi:hypothetical protein